MRSVRSIFTLISAVSTLMLALIAPPALAAGETMVERIGGSTRIETAVLASQFVFADHDAPAFAGSGQRAASAVTIVRSDVAADALIAVPTAFREIGPILLTPGDALSSVTRQELRRVLDTDGTVFFFGGDAAISDAVVEEVEDLGYSTVRYAGVHRYATSERACRDYDPQNLFLANGNGYTAPLVAGPLAALYNGCLLLTNAESLTVEVEDLIEDNSTLPRATVGAVAGQADPNAGDTVTGGSPAELAVNAAEGFFTEFHSQTVVIASSEDFPDGLTGGLLAALLDGVLLLTEEEELSEPTRRYLVQNADNVNLAVIMGGTAAIDDSVEQDVEDILGV